MIKDQDKFGILFVGYFLSQFSLGRCVGEDLSKKFKELDYRIITTSEKTNRVLRVIDMLATTISKRHDYESAYVEVYNGMAFIWAEMVCYLLRLLRKPYIITLHGGRLPQFSKKWPIRFKRMLKNANLVTTPSNLYVEIFKGLRSDIIYLPNAIDVDFYAFRHREKASPKIAWMRKFETYYNPGLVAKSLTHIHREHPNVKIFMGGADSGDGSYEDMIANLQRSSLLDNVIIEGYIARPNISDWFSKADIYINTPNIESFGITVMEAAAAGLCIVTTKVGELPFIWSDGQNALLVPPDDPKAMSDAVLRILNAPDLCSRLSLAGRKKAENYDWSIILPQWEALFQALIGAD